MTDPDTADVATAISLRDLVKRFDGADHAAVDGLTLDIERGHIVALVGPSGCGKTTTLKMINRLIEPTSGSIEVLGRDARAQPAHELRRTIGYVIQQVGLFPHRTVAANIGVVPELLGWDDTRVTERSAELIELVGLDPSLLDRYPAELSGGQQQRVGVARALAADPPILLMDEPYSAVDPIVRERLQDELLLLQEKVHKTIVFVTHDIDEALKLADRVALLNVGGILEQYDAPDGLLRAPASPFVASFLGRERGLRRLGLRTVADVTLSGGPSVRSTGKVRDAMVEMDRAGTRWAAVVDGHRLLGRVDHDRLAGCDEAAALAAADVHEFGAVVGSDTPLREALDAVVTSPVQVAAVVDTSDRLAGFVTIGELAAALGPDE